MKLRFIFLGKKNPYSWGLIIDNYLKRLNVYSTVEVVFFNENNSLKMEQKVFKQITPNSFFIVLDNNGLLLDTAKYAQFIQDKSLYNSVLIFLIGGAYGVPSNIMNRADKIISLSKMTFPHSLARLILIEQTYRALTILQNHPYHHE